MQTPQNVIRRFQQYPDAHYRKHFQGKQGRISNGRLQHQSHKL